jgi:hypothetical protein
MEPADWMNEQVRDEIETLQRTHGFEEEEAVAFWLLQQAWKQMHTLRRVDIVQETGRHEGRPDQLALQHALVLNHVVCRDKSAFHSPTRSTRRSGVAEDLSRGMGLGSR